MYNITGPGYVLGDNENCQAIGSGQQKKEGRVKVGEGKRGNIPEESR